MNMLEGRPQRLGQIENEVSNATSRVQLFSDPTFASTLFDSLDSRLKRGTAGVLSLDVFDTLVLRDDKSELRRFWEIAGEVARSINETGDRGVSPADALSARYLATLASYRASMPVRGCREGSLTEIHALSSVLLTAGQEFVDKFVAIELEYEAQRVTPNRLLLEYAERHRSMGGRVILVTDMYMHADHVRQLLRNVGVPDGLFTLVISSADEKVSKASGGIFSIIERKLGACPKSFLHVGDSLVGDYLRPRTRGWSAFLLPISQEERRLRRQDHQQMEEYLLAEAGLDFPLIKLPQ
jgi:FMN phosphatase YigB (HAD superfamily)